MSELDLAAIAARVAVATTSYQYATVADWYCDDVPALLAEVERLTDERAVLVTRWHDRAEAAEALVAEKAAEIERLADVAETNTAAYEYAVVERDDLRARVEALADEWQAVYDRWISGDDIAPRVAIFRVHANKVRRLLDITTAEEE